MILYFSATGNSRWVAQQLATLTGDTLLNLVECMKQEEIPEALTHAECLGIVFPIHGWAAPVILTDYLKRLSLPRLRYCYAVCTCGDDVGKSIQLLGRVIPLHAAWSVLMPDTYVPLFQVDKPEKARRKIAAARQLLPQIARSVLAREAVWSVHEGVLPWAKSHIVQPLFLHCYISDRGFHVDDGCTSCGKCVRLCPVDNIRLPADGLPVWQNRCIHCMACLHGCPQAVIQYKKATQKKTRYRLSDYLTPP